MILKRYIIVLLIIASCQYLQNNDEQEAMNYHLIYRYTIDSPEYPLGCAPVINENEIYTLTNERLIKLNISMKDTIWTKEIQPFSYVGDFLCETTNEILVGTWESKELMAIDMSNGMVNYIYELPNRPTSRTKLFPFKNDLLAVGGSENRLIIFNWNDKSVILDKTIESPESIYSFVSNVVIVDDSLLVCSTNEKLSSSPITIRGGFYCINYLTGNIKWSLFYNPTDEEKLWGITNNLDVLDSKVYNLTRNKLVCIDVYTGGIEWQKLIDNYSGTGPWIINSSLYIGTDSRSIHKIDPITGDIIWTNSIDFGSFSGPIIISELGIMAQVGAVLHVFDEDNGEELQEINAPNGNGYSDNCILSGAISHQDIVSANACHEILIYKLQ